MDVSNISLQDYSVKVDDVPKTATPAEIGTFFSKFGKVHQVTLGTDVGKLIGKHRKRSEMVFQREELHAAVCKSRGKSIVAKEQLRNTSGAWRSSRLLRRDIERTGPYPRSWCSRPRTAGWRERKMQPTTRWRGCPAQEVPVQRHAQAVDPSRARGRTSSGRTSAPTGGAAAAGASFRGVRDLLMVCTCAMVVGESAQSTVPSATPAIPEEAGTLLRHLRRPYAEREGDLVEVKAMMSG